MHKDSNFSGIYDMILFPSSQILVDLTQMTLFDFKIAFYAKPEVIWMF